MPIQVTINVLIKCDHEGCKRERFSTQFPGAASVAARKAGWRVTHDGTIAGNRALCPKHQHLWDAQVGDHGVTPQPGKE